MALFRRNKDDEPSSKDQKKDEVLRALFKRVEAMVKAGEESNKVPLQMYRDAMNYSYGNQLVDIRLKKGWEGVQCNYVTPAMMQMLGFISQQKVAILANPWEEEDQNGAEFATGYLQYQYDKGLKMQAERLQWMLDGFTNGAWGVYAEWEEQPDGGWNAETREWEGAVKLRTLRPEEYGADPNLETPIVEEGEYAYIKRPESVDRLKEKWSDFKTEIEAAAKREKAEGEKQDGGIGGIYVTGASEAITDDSDPVNTREKDTGPGGREGRLAHMLFDKQEESFVRKDGNVDKAAKVTLTQIWFKDREIAHVVEEEPFSYEDLQADGRIELDDQIGWVFTGTGEEVTEGNRPIRVEEYDAPVYPNGRYVVMVGDTILNPKKEDQVWREEQWPLFIGRFKILPHTWRGMNGVELMRSLQDWANISATHMLNFLKYFGDPVWVVEQGALANVSKDKDIPQRVAAAAGTLIVARPGKSGGIRREPAPRISEAIFRIFELMDRQIRNATGMHEIIQGIQAKGTMTASEALRLETNSRIQIALLLINLDAFTLNLMEWVFGISKQHMEVGQMVRIMGEQEREQTEEVMEGDFDAQFDLKMEVGTALPFDQERKKNEALQLYEIMGPPFLKRLLEAYEVANLDELLMASEAWMMIQQMLEQQEAEGGGEGGGEGEMGGGGMPSPEESMAAGTGIQQGPPANAFEAQTVGGTF